MAEADLLTVENLTLVLDTADGGRPLVKDLSFTIGENRIMGLIGESGSGKSLTCLAVMGLLPGNIRKTGGDIRFRGSSIADLPEPRLRAMRGRTIGMILQNPMSCFDAVFTIRHHFAETLLSHEKTARGAMEKRMQDALASVGFERPRHILGLYPFQMSGGMLQRVMVAPWLCSLGRPCSLPMSPPRAWMWHPRSGFSIFWRRSAPSTIWPSSW